MVSNKKNRREKMTKVFYVNADLNKVVSGKEIAANTQKFTQVHQDAVIAEKNLDLNSDQVIFHNCPKGYSLVDEVDENYNVEYDKVYVPIQVEYGNIKDFKNDAFDIHDHESSEYFQKWLLCSFLADSLPFNVAARVEAWFGEE